MRKRMFGVAVPFAAAREGRRSVGRMAARQSRRVSGAELRVA
jgi:hypothetical protein